MFYCYFVAIDYSSLDDFYTINFMFFFTVLSMIACASVACVLKYLLTYLLTYVLTSGPWSVAGHNHRKVIRRDPIRIRRHLAAIVD